jgi:hypothetical protein
MVGIGAAEVRVHEPVPATVAPHCAARAVTQCWYWAAISRSTALLTG